MSLLVVDSSVAVKWFFGEIHTNAARRALKRPVRLHAPDLLLLEADNVVCKRIRRGELTFAEGDRIRAGLRAMPVQTHSFLPLLEPGYAIACRTGRSLYDCLYVALAELLDGRMVTADRRLYDALAAGPFAPRVLWIESLL